MTAKIEVYTTSFCRRCVATRAFLARYSIEYTEYRLDLLPPERDEMVRRCGSTSVPQVFFSGVHLGGHDELMAMHARGELDELIAP